MKSRFPGAVDRTYLNSCSFGLPPDSTGAVYARWQHAMDHFEDDAFGEIYAELERFRERLADFIGGDRGSCWVDQNGSALLARIALGLPRRGRHRVLITDLEFPSAATLFGTLPGVELEVVPSVGGCVPTERLLDAIDDDTWLVYASHATSVTGAILRGADELGRKTARHGAYLGLDVYQSVGCLPVDVDALGADFVIGGGHKWLLGAWDLGYAWLSPRAREALEPVAAGWFAGADPFTFDEQRSLARDARCLAAGAPDPLACMLTSVGLDVIEGWGVDAIRSHSQALTERLIEGSRWPVVGPRDAEARGGTVCLAVPNAGRARASLLERAIVVSVRRLPDGTEGLRVAPHLYNTVGDVDGLLEALGEVA